MNRRYLEDVDPNTLLTVTEPLPSPGGDFNDDGAFGCLDIDSLVAQIASDTNDSAYDLTSGGQSGDETP